MSEIISISSLSDYVELAVIDRDQSSPTKAESEDSRPTINSSFILIADRNEAPADEGARAWFFLVGAFFIEAIVWSVPSAFGVFLAYYLQNPEINSLHQASSLLPLIGTLSSGITYCTGPFTFSFVARFPRCRRLCLWVGTCLCWISLFSASYTVTESLNLLVFLQGVLWALGGVLLYAPCLSYMSEWFIRRRGIANGILFAGTSAGGLMLPIALPPLINEYGVATALRILSFVVLGVLLLVLPSMWPRLPESCAIGSSSPTRRPDRSWMKNRTFWIFNIVNTIHGFAYFIPLLYLPTFTSKLYPNDYTKSSIPLSLINGFSIFSCLAIGFLSDHLDPWILALGSLLCVSLTVFVLWGALSPSLLVLSIFGVAYGIFAGGWCVLWTSFLKLLTNDPSLSTSLFGMFMFFRGLGNILSTPIAAALLRDNGRSLSSPSDIDPHPSSGFQVAKGQYEDMILYVGICFSVASLVAVIGWRLEKSCDR